MADSKEKLFTGIGKATDRVGRASAPLFRRLLSWVAPKAQEHAQDWAGDADWAQLQQEPLRARLLLRISAVVLLLLIMWSAVATVDEVTRGEAKVVPTSQVQIIQSVDGGVVDEILVKEGQMVQAGQLLLKVDPTRFASSLGEARVNQEALQARVARLRALTQGTAFSPPPELVKRAPELVAQERGLYESKREEINAQVEISRNQLSQRQQELREMESRRATAQDAITSNQRELNVTKNLVSSGAASPVEVLRLEREVQRLIGERDQASAQISRVRAAIAEAQRRIQEVQLNARNQLSAELSETMGRLKALNESGRALEDKVNKAEIRSPVKGYVKRLLVNTVAGVVQPGKEVVEIVPADDALILEAQIAPKDIAFLRPELEATVKFTAYDFAIYGGLQAKVQTIGADSVVNEKGEAFYLVRLRTDQHSLGDNLPIIPGMVAQVDILTGKKTVLSYLLKPVLRAKSNALSER